MKFYILAFALLAAVLAGTAYLLEAGGGAPRPNIPAAAPSQDDAAMKNLRIN